jgi:hypothetical protein
MSGKVSSGGTPGGPSGFRFSKDDLREIAEAAKDW